jgi:hypothetical protein
MELARRLTGFPAGPRHYIKSAKAHDIATAQKLRNRVTEQKLNNGAMLQHNSQADHHRASVGGRRSGAL